MFCPKTYSVVLHAFDLIHAPSDVGQSMADATKNLVTENEVQELNYVKISPGEATMAGYECVPLTGDEFYGNTFTKAECEKNWREPSTESVDFSSRNIAQDFSKDPQVRSIHWMRWSPCDPVRVVNAIS